ncbi:hypothetical protein J8990_00860 [Klebsiella quasipneumoniae subsp. quasipneumoniae]
MLVVEQLAVAYHPPVLDVHDYPPGKIREDMQIHVQHAGIKADGVEEMASTYRGFASKDGCSVNMKCSYNLTAERAESYAAYIRHQMREGADK